MSQYYIQPGQIKKIRSTPLAFTVPDDLPQVTVTGTTTAWTSQALTAFNNIHQFAYDQQEQVKELPYASLRSRLEVGLEEVTRIEPHIGLKRSILKGSRNSNFKIYPFAYLIDTDAHNAQKKLRPVLSEWIVNDLRPFAHRKGVPENLLDRIDDLWEQNDLVNLSAAQSQVPPWSWSEESGTAIATNHVYTTVVDYISRLIAGHEVFEGLGLLRRVISEYRESKPELMTAPISIPDKGTFSLVVTLEIITFPSVHQPLLKIEVSKRRWLSDLQALGIDRRKISGYAFSQNLPDRVFSFKMICKKDDSEVWDWKTGEDFEVLRRPCKIAMQPFNGLDISLGHADGESCQIVLTHRNGLGKHTISVGVPEIDKLEAFDKIHKIIEPIGLSPFDSYEPIKNKNKGNRQLEPREIDLSALMNAILASSDSHASAFTQEYLNQFDDSQLSSLLTENIGFALEEIKGGRKAFQPNAKNSGQTKTLEKLIQENKKALRRLYPNEKLRLFIFHQNKLLKEASLLKKISQLLWGQSIEIVVNTLPDDTHGSKGDLSGSDRNAQERSEMRIRQWSSISRQILEQKGRTFCLVLAAKFFRTDQDESKRDDPVNKPSTRRALAGDGGACVQFITPVERTKSNHVNLEGFSRRSQQALKDLLSAHSGRVDGIKAKVDGCLSEIPAELRPKEIIGITIIRKQKGRVRGKIEATFLPIAIRLQVESGKCEMCWAYEENNSMVVSAWTIFPDALAQISKLSPVRLANDRQPETLKTRFTEFVEQVVSGSVESGAQPLVMIDSTNCVRIWGWLADIRMDANNIDLGSHAERMQQVWAGARIVRIRQGLAPGIIDGKERQLVSTYSEDARPKDELKELSPDIVIPSASSSTGLFRLAVANSTGCVAYLSVGGKSLHHKLRGQSCYRSTNINASTKIENAASLTMGQLIEKEPLTDHLPTPNPLEIVVALRQPGDNPDHIAALVEALRYVMGHYAESTALPAPLFLERVVRDYISDFLIEEEQSSAEE